MYRTGVVFHADIITVGESFSVPLPSVVDKYKDDIRDLFEKFVSQILEFTDLDVQSLRLEGKGSESGYENPVWRDEVVAVISTEEKLTKQDFLNICDLASLDESLARYKNMRVKKFRYEDYPTKEKKAPTPAAPSVQEQAEKSAPAAPKFRFN